MGFKERGFRGSSCVVLEELDGDTAEHKTRPLCLSW